MTDKANEQPDMSKDGNLMHKQHHGWGIFYAVLASLMTALIGITVKLIGDRASTNVVLFVRYSLNFCFILPFVFKSFKKTIIVHRPLQLLLRSVCTLLASGGFFYALKYIPLANAILLSTSYPLFVPLILWFTHRTVTSPMMWGGLFLGFIGVLLVLHPDPHGFKLPSIYALSAGIFAAAAVILIRQLTKWATVEQILFYNFLIAIVITGVFLPFFSFPENWVSLIPLFVAMGLCTISYQYLSTLSLAKAPARLVSPIVFLSVVFGVALDYFVWGHVPHWYVSIGILAVIVGGGITILYGQKDLQKK